MIVGLIDSCTPLHIWRGKVRCSEPAMNNATTTSSKEVMNANNAPEATPGAITGSITRKKACTGLAPRLAAARIRL